MRRLTVTDAELAVTAEALREAMAAGLLTPTSRTLARELLDRIDAKLPSASDHHPAGPTTGRVLAGDEILRLLLRREDRHGQAALSNEAIAGELSWKPAGTSVRALLEDMRRGGWLLARGDGGDRLFELTAKGRGRARALQHAGAAPDDEARISTPDELLDLIYADSAPATISFTGERTERIPSIWHRPTVHAAARVDHRRFCELETALRDAALIGEQIHSYGTLTPTGEHHARERWHVSRLPRAFGPPPRLSAPVPARRLGHRPHGRSCLPELRRVRVLADPTQEQALGRAARARRGRLQLPALRRALDDLPRAHRTGRSVRPARRPALCRPRWRYRGGWLHGDALAPADHHPPLIAA